MKLLPCAFVLLAVFAFAGMGFEPRIGEAYVEPVKVTPDLTVIDVQSYPSLYGNWTVGFNTAGTANLTIRAVDGTEFGEDIEFLELRCGDNVLAGELIDGAVFVEDYGCGETGYETSKVLTTGKHALEFRFGGDVEYAYNSVGGPTQFSLNDDATDIGMTPLDESTFAICWVDDLNADVVFRVFDTNGTVVTDTVIVDSTVDTTARCDVEAFNSTHFVLALYDPTDEDIDAAVYDKNGNVVTSIFQVDSSVGTTGYVDVAVTTFDEDTFAVCWSDDSDNDFNVESYEIDGTQNGAEVSLDTGQSPATTSDNLADCSAVDGTQAVGVWFDDGSNDATMRSFTSAPAALSSGTDEDTDIGETGKVAVAALEDLKYVFVFHDGAATNDPLRFSVRQISGSSLNQIGVDTVIDSNAGTNPRVAVAAINDTSYSGTSFVVAWLDSNANDIKAAVYYSNLTQKTAAFTVDSNPDATFLLLDVMGFVNSTTTSLCNNTFIVAYDNSSDRGVFKRYFDNGTEWNGICPKESTPPTISNAQFNESSVSQNEAVRFNVTVTDDTAVDTVNATFQKPDLSKVNQTLTRYWDLSLTDNSTDKESGTVSKSATGGGVTNYNFSTGGGTDKWGWSHANVDGGESVTPFENINPWDYVYTQQSSEVTYSQVASTDQTFWVTTNPGWGDYAVVAFNFTISEDPNDITELNFSWVGYKETTGNLKVLIRNQTDGSWDYVTWSMSSTSSPGEYEEWIITEGFSKYISAGGYLYIMIGDEDSNEQFWTDSVNVKITTPAAATDALTSYTEYTDVTSTTYSNVTNITVTVQVDTYNPEGSVQQSTDDPDLQLAIYDGSDYVTIGNLSLNVTYTGDGLQTTDYNFSLSTTDSTILDAWETASNRDLRIRGVKMDYYDSTTIDEINYTGIWVDVNYENQTDIYYYDWTDTSAAGTYNATYVWANDTLDNANATTYTDVSFTVSTGDSTPPSITDETLNETAINRNEAVRLNASTADPETDVTAVTFTIKYPNGTSANFSATEVSTNYWEHNFSVTSDVGQYNWTNTYATSGGGTNSTAPGLTFTVSGADVRVYAATTTPSEVEPEDTITQINVTVNNTGNADANNVNVTLRFLYPNNTQVTGWGPQSEYNDTCGTVTAGQLCSVLFSNYAVGSSETTPGVYKLNITTNWSSESNTNSTATFTVYYMPDNISSALSPTSIAPGEYGNYTINVTNPWSASLTGVNVTAVCPAQITCSCESDNCVIGTITSGNTGSKRIIANTTASTPAGDYNLSAYVNYTNPNSNTYQRGSNWNRTLTVGNTTNITQVVANDTNPLQGETIELIAELKYANGTAIADQNVSFYYGSTYIDYALTNSSGWAKISWDTTGVTAGIHTINATYDGNSSVYALASSNDTRQVTVKEQLTITIDLDKSSYSWFGDVNVTANITYPNGTAALGLNVYATSTVDSNENVTLTDADSDGNYTGTFRIGGSDGSAKTTGSYTIIVNASGPTSEGSATSSSFSTFIVRRWSGITTSDVTDSSDDYTDFNTTGSGTSWHHHIKQIGIDDSASRSGVIVRFPIFPKTNTISNLQVTGTGGTVVNSYWIDTTDNIIVIDMDTTSAVRRADIEFDAKSDLAATYIDRINTGDLGDRLSRNGYAVWNKYIFKKMIGTDHDGIGEFIDLHAIEQTDTGVTHTVDCMEREAIQYDGACHEAAGTTYYDYNIHWTGDSRDFLKSNESDNTKLVFDIPSHGYTGTSAEHSTAQWVGGQYYDVNKSITFYANEKYHKYNYTIKNKDSSAHTTPLVIAREPWIYGDSTDRATNDRGIFPGDATDYGGGNMRTASQLSDSWLADHDTGPFYSIAIIYASNNTEDKANGSGFMSSASGTVPLANAACNYPLKWGTSSTNADLIVFERNYTSLGAGKTVSFAFWFWAGYNSSRSNLVTDIGGDADEIETAPPTFSGAQFNESSVSQNDAVRFNVTVTDEETGADTVIATFRYPDTTEVNQTLSILSGDTYYYDWTDTSTAGTYNVTYVWANDTLNNANGTTYTDVSFTVTSGGDSTPPTISDPQFNESTVGSNEAVRFNVTVTDGTSVDTVIATFRYPNGTLVNQTLSNPSGDTYQYNWTDTSQGGTYNVTYVWANDTLGNADGTIYASVSFSVGEVIDVTLYEVPIQFAATDPGSGYVFAQVDNGYPMNVTVESTTNVKTNLSLKGDANFVSGGNTFAIGNLSYVNKSSGTYTDMTASYPTAPAYNDWGNIPLPAADTNRSVYFRISVPSGQETGTYTATVTVKVETA